MAPFEFTVRIAKYFLLLFLYKVPKQDIMLFRDCRFYRLNRLGLISFADRYVSVTRHGITDLRYEKTRNQWWYTQVPKLGIILLLQK